MRRRDAEVGERIAHALQPGLSMETRPFNGDRNSEEKMHLRIEQASDTYSSETLLSRAYVLHQQLTGLTIHHRHWLSIFLTTFQQLYAVFHRSWLPATRFALTRAGTPFLSSSQPSVLSWRKLAKLLHREVYPSIATNIAKTRDRFENVSTSGNVFSNVI